MTGGAGENFAAAEIHRLGGWAATVRGNMPGIDLIASDEDYTRSVTIQVKTKRSGTWHANAQHGAPTAAPIDEQHYWVFVDLGSRHPDFYVAPRWWVLTNIHEFNSAFLARNGGKRPRTEGSTHHAIDAKRVTQWKDRWDLLGIGLQEPA